MSKGYGTAIAVGGAVIAGLVVIKLLGTPETERPPGNNSGNNGGNNGGNPGIVGPGGGVAGYSRQPGEMIGGTQPIENHLPVKRIDARKTTLWFTLGELSHQGGIDVSGILSQIGVTFDPKGVEFNPMIRNNADPITLHILATNGVKIWDPNITGGAGWSNATFELVSPSGELLRWEDRKRFRFQPGLWEMRMIIDVGIPALGFPTNQISETRAVYGFRFEVVGV